MTGSKTPRGLHMQKEARSGERVIALTEEERTARIRLAACYRVFDVLGWIEAIFNHITVRVPGPDTVFLINPFGLHYSEVTASNLVAVDISGQPPTERVPGQPRRLRHSQCNPWSDRVGTLCDAHASDIGHRCLAPWRACRTTRSPARSSPDEWPITTSRA